MLFAPCLSRALLIACLGLMGGQVQASDMAVASRTLDASGNAADMTRQVRAWVQTWSDESGQPAQLQWLGSWGKLQAQAGPVLARMDVKALNARTRQVDVLLTPDSSAAASATSGPATMRFLLRDQMPVWVAKLPLTRGAALNCDALTREWRSSAPASALTAADCTSGLEGRLRRSLAPGDVLVSSDLAVSLPAVQDRAATVLTVKVGGVEVQARGRALADAQVGQAVALQVEGARSLIHTVVVAPGQVQLMERTP